MQKKLTIKTYQDPSYHIDSFLSGWQKYGSYQKKTLNSFQLIGKNNKQSLLSIEKQCISIEGDIPSETFMLIDALDKACEADQVLEGEVLGKNTFDRTFNGNQQTFSNASNFQIPLGMKSMINISGMSKFKVILMLIVAIPLLLVMIPVMIVYLIIKVILFKIKFR